MPNSVETSHKGKVAILWNNQVRTDRIIPNNKPDIKIRDNKQGTCMLIDVAIPGGRNVLKKEAEKIVKHKDLITEIKTTRIFSLLATDVFCVVLEISCKLIHAT